MAYSSVWSARPVGTVAANQIDDEIRQLRTDIADRLIDLFGLPNFTDDPLKPQYVRLGYTGSGTGGHVKYTADSGTLIWKAGILPGIGNVDFSIYDSVNSASRLTINAGTGQVGILAGLNVTGGAITNTTAAAGNTIFSSAVSGDTSSRFVTNGIGSFFWGPGNAGTDTNLYRGSSSSLVTDGNFSAGNNLNVGNIGTFNNVIRTGKAGIAGQVQFYDDGGASHWVIGVPGNAGARGFFIYDNTTGRQVIGCGTDGNVGLFNNLSASGTLTSAGLSSSGPISGTTGTFSGNVSGASANFSGTVTGTFSGNLTGNVTGNVTGSSGSCTGNAATATNASQLGGVAAAGYAQLSGAAFTGNITVPHANSVSAGAFFIV